MLSINVSTFSSSYRTMRRETLQGYGTLMDRFLRAFEQLQQLGFPTFR